MAASSRHSAACLSSSLAMLFVPKAVMTASSSSFIFLMMSEPALPELASLVAFATGKKAVSCSGEAQGEDEEKASLASAEFVMRCLRGGLGLTTTGRRR